MDLHLSHPSLLEPEKADLLREIMVQLVRNAIVHGIETPAVRQAARKPAAGEVYVCLTREGDGWSLRVRDDGAGLSVRKIEKKLIDLGWFSKESLAQMNSLEVIQNIFKPQFSTAEEVGMHAGRGVGLDVVMDNVRKLRSKNFRVSSQPGRYTEFFIKFS